MRLLGLYGPLVLLVSQPTQLLCVRPELSRPFLGGLLRRGILDHGEEAVFGLLPDLQRTGGHQPSRAGVAPGPILIVDVAFSRDKALRLHPTFLCS